MSFIERLGKRLENFPTPRLQIEALRAELGEQARGDVLEVGFGTGLNLPHLRNVREYVGLDPEIDKGPLTKKRLSEVSFPVMLIPARAEAIPFEDESFDTVVLTWTLCTVEDPVKTLSEIRRVMKADGRLLAIEHGRAPDLGIRALQLAWSPLQRQIAAGCHITRDVPALLASAGFVTEKTTARYLSGPRPLTFTYVGSYRKA